MVSWGSKLFNTTTLIMSPIVSLLAESSDPLDLQLLETHRLRYERIKAWREAQSDPYFTEVPMEWRREFECSRSRKASATVSDFSDDY